ncbi:uncharacterized protein LOC112553576 [Pomacea canaliculata]|uniref:uncharacterized protein LOC112553576 n=1 Tax=Pomacea canaliculata TaxID=400727 RepID=UPI000D73141E|nr:uncharacterized protein LOC112553576 [Pomacea canaliculata]
MLSKVDWKLPALSFIFYQLTFSGTGVCGVFQRFVFCFHLESRQIKENMGNGMKTMAPVHLCPLQNKDSRGSNPEQDLQVYLLQLHVFPRSRSTSTFRTGFTFCTNFPSCTFPSFLEDAKDEEKILEDDWSRRLT